MLQEPSTVPLVDASREELVEAPSNKFKKSKPCSVFMVVRVKVIVAPAGAVKVVEGHAQLFP